MLERFALKLFGNYIGANKATFVFLYGLRERIKS